jgi:hypothetical protein
LRIGRTKKKTNSNITGRTVSALLTEELLENIMLAKTTWGLNVTSRENPVVK